jgi:hypothetical protein
LGLGVRVLGLGVWVYGSWLRGKGQGLGIYRFCVGVRAQNLRFWVLGSGFDVKV